MSHKPRSCLYWVLALCLAACDSTADTKDGSFRANAADGVQAAGAKLLAAVARDQRLEVWTADPSVRVQPTTAVGSGRRVIVEGPRAAYESYQVVVHARSERHEDVNFMASDLSDGRGHTLRASNITFFREWFVDFDGVNAENGNKPVPRDSPTRDTRVADPLIPFIDPYTGKALGAPFGVDAGMNRPVWVDVFIAADTAPGEYAGTITVTGRDQKSIAVPIAVTVWDLVLPDQRAVQTFFQMDVDPLINFHRETWACDGGSCYLEWHPQARVVIKRYEELAHSHRIDVGQTFVRGPGRADDCAEPTDWAEYDEAIQPYMDGSYFADRVPSTRLQIPLTPGADYGAQTCAEAQYKAIAKAWAHHLKSKRWFDRAIIFAEDEPPPEVWPALAKHAR